MDRYYPLVGFVLVAGFVALIAWLMLRLAVTSIRKVKAMVPRPKVPEKQGEPKALEIPKNDAAVIMWDERAKRAEEESQEILRLLKGE